MSAAGGQRARLVALLGVGALIAGTLLPGAGGGLARDRGEVRALPLAADTGQGSGPAVASAPLGAAASLFAHAAPPGRRPPQAPVPGGTLVPAPVPLHPVLAAADFLDVSTATTYLVDPGAREVRVVVDVTAVNRLPVAPGARDYYPTVGLAVQREARQFAAEEGGTRDAITTMPRVQDRLLTIQLAERLYVGQTAHVRVSYALPTGAPRSPSPVRVGAAYASFVAWAIGDRGTVSVVVPAQFTAGISGSAMDEGTNASGQQVLRATVADPSTWYAWVDARNDSALTSRSLRLANGERVVVHAWPEDPTWEKAVSKTLTTAIPALEKRIGLRWPVSGQLSVLEVSSARLEGYAGFYSAGTKQITISEALDPIAVVHEASHAWFNASLFTDRWITEGLADEYASRTLAGLGVAAEGPGKVRANAAEAFALDTWGTPAPIRTPTQNAREQWAYDASWTVIRKVVGKLGEARMAVVLAAADAGTSAYSVAGQPMRSAARSDWRRFVDLAEEVGGGRAVAELISPWVLTPAERALLAPRAAARSAYHDLLAQGGGWAPPVVVRAELDAWDFAGASAATAAAAALLAVRDGLRTAAAAEGLAVPAVLEGAYESASTVEALAKSADDEQALRRSLDAVAAAGAALQSPRDWLVSLGLIGQDPSGALVAARAAWASGDATAAADQATDAYRALAVAADAGRLRLAAIGAGTVALALLVILAFTIARRRPGPRRGTAGVVAGAPPAQPGAPAVPGPCPILPASAPIGPTPQSHADRKDEGAQ